MNIEEAQEAQVFAAIARALATMARRVDRETANKAIEMLQLLLQIATPQVPLGSFAWRVAAEYLRVAAGEDASVLALLMLEEYNLLRTHN